MGHNLKFELHTANQMKRHCYKFIFFILPAVIMIASCKISKRYSTPDIYLNNLYRDVNDTDTANLATISWKTLFSDTILRNLIQEGLINNLNLKIAIERINDATAALTQSKLASYPAVSGNISANPSRQSLAALNLQMYPGYDVNSTIYEAALNISWEADVWGKISSFKRAALARYLQTDAAKRVIQTQLVADIANSYFDLLALDKQLKITKKTVENRVAEVQTMKYLKAGAIVTGAAVAQSEANRYAAEVSVPEINQNIREIENAVCILVGRAPGPVNRTSLDQQNLVTTLNTGVPMSLLHNRPDVEQAEYAFREAFENTNVARSYFYPSFSITAQGGLSTLSLSNFFTGSFFVNLLTGVTQPILSQGQNKARLKSAKAQQNEALFNFQQSLLTSGEEVSNALFSYQSAVEKEEVRAKQVAALLKAVDYTKELMRYSSVANYTDVLTSEQNLLAAELNSVNDSVQKLHAIVNLYRALGGGWN
ncbi:MAG TPA: TolC family protein [Mucilaginibacter sp.]|jgi:NodT family efflux transporter outer membrane factor (OMF) lipoprotein|nr:TolC family protein [Mucilaginibacter sp.]